MTLSAIDNKGTDNIRQKEEFKNKKKTFSFFYLSFNIYTDDKLPDKLRDVAPR